MKRGSALLMALVTIAVLSIMVISFVYEARQQGGINLYVRERNRIARLIEAGRLIAEVVIKNYPSVADWTPGEDLTELMEKDRWLLGKRDLKDGGQCVIGPLLLDETRDDDGNFVNPATVTIEIGSSNGDGKLNVNTLCEDAGDAKWMERWWMIFKDHNIPEELATPKDGTINLWNILIASWNDWRDDNDNVTNIELEEAGAENKWYEEYEADNDLDKDEFMEYQRRPRNGRIPDVGELENLRGWREYPQVLTGGVINPWENRKEDQVDVHGITDVLSVYGTEKININNCKNLHTLITIPGIYGNVEDDDVLEEAKAVAQAVLAARSVMPDDRDVDPTKSEWPFKDFDDLCRRVDEVGEDIGSEASNYLQYTSDDFTVKITGESMGMTHTIEAKCYVKDGEIRYYMWNENPTE